MEDNMDRFEIDLFEIDFYEENYKKPPSKKTIFNDDDYLTV